MEKEYEPNDFVIYQNGDQMEIGRIKRLCNDGRSAFVWYHSGETAAKTPIDHLHPISNDYCIIKTALGGEQGEEDI